MVCENMFTAAPCPNGWRWWFPSKKRLCYNFLGDSKIGSASKSKSGEKSKKIPDFIKSL